MHRLGIKHRDIKLANVVMTSTNPDDLNVKIVDMGFAKFQNFNEEDIEFCGSPLYMAPEILFKLP